MEKEDDQVDSNQSIDYESIQKELSSVKLSRSILHERFNEIVEEIEEYREIRYVAEKSETKTIEDDSVSKR